MKILIEEIFANIVFSFAKIMTSFFDKIFIPLIEILAIIILFTIYPKEKNENIKENK